MEKLESLARELVALPDFRWLDGMKILGQELRARPLDAKWWNECRRDFRHLLPDLGDAATRGCVLELVREATEEPASFCEAIFVDGEHVGWLVVPAVTMAMADTEAEALVAALESALESAS